MKISKNRDHPMDSQGFDALRSAVVERACNDYLTAGPHEKATIRKWFLDSSFSFWSKMRPHVILAQLEYMRSKNQKTLYSQE